MTVAAVLAGEKRWAVVASDALAFLQGLPDGCVHCACTSPPYFGLRAYLKADSPLKPLEMGQEKTPADYVAGMVRLFRELRRVLRDDGVFWLNVGDSYAASGKSGGGKQGEKWTDHGADTVGPRGGKWSPAPAGLKPLDQCNIPHRLYIALIEDGWYGRADCVWSKLSSMPESLTGWRWVRCRVRTNKPMRTPDGTKQNEYTGSKRSAVTVADKKDREALRQQIANEMWSDCPGCAKCDQNGGYILRKGSWRPTRSHEFVFMLAKSASYFCDGDAVRTPLSPVTLARDQYSRILDDPDEQCAVQHDHETPSNPGGANPRSVFRLDATAEDVFRWLHEQDPALAETLHARWREGQGLHSVLRVGPEPLKAAHYAAYPTALITPLIRAGTSERGACPECGSPWARVVDKQQTGKVDYEGKNADTEPQSAARRMLAGVRAAREAGGDHANPFPEARTIGWRATCNCGRADTVPCVVLDPFAGSGRTGIVARRLGLRFLGSELNPEFASLARNAIVGDAIDAPLAVGKAAPSLFDGLEG